ncbi:MAG: hypothetical protein B7Y12_05860 [Rhizobiales bacterium 24-66-13]|nr:MAG: hypothetical protein B7Y12_05860 [Rhizobiales bacterium 24-66-13]OZB10095.1 MAG: hypothetical protein B7X67_06345 [Rhizobiales bacterium 39-66-18]HQS47165.1 restriction endonuclease [Xanthobacteraceae bacterium]
MTETKPEPRFRTCFVSGPAGQATEAIADMLTGFGVAVLSANAISLGASLTDEILRGIASADFIVVVLTDQGAENAIFELGVARGMNKPALVFTFGRMPPSDLHGIIYRSLDSLDRLPDVAADIARFLRNAKSPPPLSDEAPVAHRRKLGWARDELRALRDPGSPHRYEEFESLIGRVLEASGADVERAGQPGADRGVDFVVWLNDVAYALGGPILVECKVLRGGSGSVIKNAEFYVGKLSKLLAKSDASLGLLVFDHDRSASPPTSFATPDVIAISVEDVINGLEAGTFEQDILQRRRRAAFVGGARE